jgi:NAD(P)-dependent dehydrogenase (short-subunit alcohol dehydrogenase family)
MVEGKFAIVTGAGSGLGEAIAIRFARSGATVVLADLDVDGAEHVLGEIKRAGGQGQVLKTDVSKADAAQALGERTVQAYGRLDIAVNNAGIGGPTAPVGEYPIEGWDQIIAINLSGLFYGMHYQIPAMLASGGDVIVNMASIAGKVGLVNAGGYTAAKHGVVGLTETAAIEYAARGIRVNAVGPGFIKTPLTGKRAVAVSFVRSGLVHYRGLLQRRWWLSRPIRRSPARRRAECRFPDKQAQGFSPSCSLRAVAARVRGGTA